MAVKQERSPAKPTSNFVTTSEIVNLTNPLLQRRATVAFTSGWKEGSVKIVSIGISPAEAKELKANLTSSVRQFIHFEIAHSDVASQINTTDNVGPEMDAMDARETLAKNIDTMRSKGIPEIEIRKLFTSQVDLAKKRVSPERIDEVVSRFNTFYTERKNQKPSGK